MNVNARGTFLTCRALLPAMAAAGSGCIVNIASTAGLSGGHTRAAYNASKGAVVMFTRSLAIDWGPRGVRVNCVCPGADRHADGRLDPARRGAARGLRALAARAAHRHARATSPTPSRSWPRTARRTCTAVRWSSMEGSRPEQLAGEGLVTSVHNQFVVVRMGGEERESTIAGRLRRARPVVGDRVEVRELPDRSVRVEAVLPRRGILLRGAFRNEEKIVAANVDVLVIVAAVADPAAPHRTDRPLPRRRLARRDRGHARAHEGRPPVRRGRGRARARDLRRARPPRGRRSRCARARASTSCAARSPIASPCSQATPASARHRSRTRSRAAPTRPASSTP